MNLALAALALFPSQSGIPLSFPGEDDGIVQSVFTADGACVLLAHGQTGSVTRVEVAQGAAIERVDLGGDLLDLKLSDSGTEAFALEGSTARLHKLMPAPLASVAAAPLSIDLSGPLAGKYGFCLDANATRAVVWGPGEASVVDLAAMTEERVISLPPITPAFEFAQRVHLSPDGQMLLVLRLVPGPAQDLILDRVDLATGSVVGTILLPTVDFQSFHSTEIHDLVLAGRSGSGDRFLWLSGSTGMVLADMTFLSSGVGGRVLTSASGNQVLLSTPNEFYRVPLATGTYSPTSPGVTRTSTGTRLLAASRNLQAVVTFASFDPLADSATRLFGLTTTGFTADIRSPRQKLRPGAFSRQEDRFCLIGEDRVQVFDIATANQGPLFDTNSGAGPEIDGAYELVLSADATLGVLIANESDNAVFLDLGIGAITGSVSLGRGPTSVARLGTDQVLVGHEDGTLAAVDIVSGQAISSFQVFGSIVEIHPVAGTTQAWVRTDGLGGLVSLPGDLLILVETAPAAAGELRRISLAGSSRVATDTRVFRAPTLAVDTARSRCYALGLDRQIIEGLDLPSGNPLFSLSTVNGAFNQNLRIGSLELSPDGTKLLRGAIAPAVEVYDVNSQGLAAAWNLAFPADQSQRPSFSSDGTAVFHNTRNLGPIVPVGPGFTAYDSATGASLGSFDIGLDQLSVATSGSQLLIAGFDYGAPQGDISSISIASFRAGTFTDVETTASAPIAMVSPDRYTAPVVLDLVKGRGYYGAVENATGAISLRILDLFEGRTQTLCQGGQPNATGVQATLSIAGSPVAGDRLSARVTGLAPGGMFGLLVAGDMTSAPTPIAGSRGSLCVSGTLGRFNGQVQTADASGTQTYGIDTSSVPSGNGLAMVQPGSTWAFQTWHRDTAPNGAATSNTSTTVAITFR